MGKVYSRAVRFVKNYNIDNRAFKELSKQESNPTSRVAPKHPTTAKIIDEFAKEHPELYQEQKTKNEELHERLKTVKVDSHGENRELKSIRPLPELRSKIDDQLHEYGYAEPNVIPKGKVSIRQAVDFISSHSLDPTRYTSQDIAKEYNLEHYQVQHVLKYFKYTRMFVNKEYLEENPKVKKMLQSKAEMSKFVVIDEEAKPKTSMEKDS